MNSVLITGGSGYFGRACAKHLLLDPSVKRVCIYSRSEHAQAAMREEIGQDERMRYFIGDVRDRERLRRAMDGIELVIHAAALKRVEVCEYDPIEVTKTNVGGAINVIEAATDARVEKIVALSSDKACDPVNAYGASKLLAEKLFLAANNGRGANGPICAVTRYGNVWGSTGSVLPRWREQLLHADTVTVTDPSCTRFFMTIQEAVQLVMDTAHWMRGGELAIPELPAFRLGDLAEAMGAKMNVIGLPPSEKRHESMQTGHSSDTACRMTVAELRSHL